MIFKNGILTKKNMIAGIIIIFIFAVIGIAGRLIKINYNNKGPLKQEKIDTASLNRMENDKAGISPDEFLKFYNLKVDENPNKFAVVVPKVWDVNAGDYPIGLYWQLANEFSKDVNLDLTSLKGNSVEVWRYSLVDGLPGSGDQSKFNYPSTVVLIVDSNKVVGAWLNFNTMSIGPSVKKRYLTDITGLNFKEWIQQNGLFTNPGKNADLEILQPVDLLKAYFKAINDGDKTRAYACLSPDSLLDSLTMNLRGNLLYNPNFNLDNSLIENIVKVNPISFKLLDPINPANEIKQLSNQTEIEVAVNIDIKWLNNQTSENGIQVRFAQLKKYKNGWKLDGLGTGP
jgi:hypothetical protein